MGICLNVYRRGAVYWWRCRFGPAEAGAKVREIALSLRTCDPRSARLLGVRLNAEVEEARRALREGGGGSIDSLRVALMQAAEDLMRADRIVTDQGHVFEISNTMLDGFVAAQAARDAERPVGALTIEVERRILVRIGRDAFNRIDRKLAALRSALIYDWRPGEDDAFARASEEGRALAVICRLLAARGSSARVDTRCRTDLAERGFSPSLIDEIAAQVLKHARGEQYRSWSIGPTYEEIVGLLTDAGVAPTSYVTARLRKSSLLLLARQLDEIERLSEQTPATVSAAYDDVLAEATAGLLARDAGTDRSGHSPVAQRPGIESDVAKSRSDEPVAGFNANSPAGPTPSFLALVEALIAKKIAQKQQAWDTKTAHQHRAVAKLFVKIAGTDDPTQLSQRYVGKYFDILTKIPKNYGKSSKDELRTIDEILGRAEDLEEDEIGLESGTINRHVVQLGTIIEHLKGNGFNCGTVFKSFRCHEGNPADKRNAFSEQDGISLFSCPIFAGFRSFNDRLSPGENIVHDSLYFIPLLSWYAMTRLGESSGLLIEDVDLVSPAIEIQRNVIRRIKNPQSKRRIALHPEIIRLGFLDYVREIKARGHNLLFPELRVRGDKTPLSALFYKDFKDVLDTVLPLAREQRKSLHSARKTGNTAMIRPDVPDPVRLKIMGHALSGVNGQHYVASFSDDLVLNALSNIQNVTRNVKAYPITLSPLLSPGWHGVRRKRGREVNATGSIPA